jgi:aminoglycoside 6'-N-acetyltransferase I
MSRPAARAHGLRIAAAAAPSLAGWAALRQALWPEPLLHALTREAEHLLARRDDTLNLLAHDMTGDVVGFAEASLRSYVNGCDSSPVAFIEGLYVMPQWRGHGVARDFCTEIAAWARAKACTELASDVLLENIASQKAHEALGFAETERVVYYRKPLF